MRKLLVTLAAGETHYAAIEGRELAIIAASAPVSIAFDDGPIQTLTKGMGVDAGAEFSRLSIYSAVAQAVGLLIDGAPRGGRRDADREASDSGSAYIGATYVAQAVNSYACAQLLNPAGSGVKLILTALWVQSSSQVQVSMYLPGGALNAALASRPNAIFRTNLEAGGASAATLGAGVSAGSNTPFGVVASPPTLFINTFLPRAQLRAPIIIAPGQSLGFVNNTANSDMAFEAEWMEEKLVASA